MSENTTDPWDETIYVEIGLDAMSDGTVVGYALYEPGCDVAFLQGFDSPEEAAEEAAASGYVLLCRGCALIEEAFT